MKTQIAATLGVCLATVLGLGSAVNPASAAVTGILTVKLNMSTNVGKTTLPPGEYSVRDIETGGATSVLEFTSANGHSVNALVREIPVEGASVQSGVVLRPEAGVYQIDKVWVEGRGHGYQLVTAESH